MAAFGNSGDFDRASKWKLRRKMLPVQRITTELNTSPGNIVFISHMQAELDAVQLAHIKTLLCMRPGNRPQPTAAYEVIRTSAEVFP